MEILRKCIRTSPDVKEKRAKVKIFFSNQLLQYMNNNDDLMKMYRRKNYHKNEM